MLVNSSLVLPATMTGCDHAWHLFVVLHPERDRIRAALQARGVETGLHYPIPIHRQEAYLHLGHGPGDFPVSERVARECLSLPLFPEMTTGQQDQVVEALQDALRQEG
jgi:dTDP-4-amino-4,6-dideoxygalactose transaminase